MIHINEISHTGTVNIYVSSVVQVELPVNIKKQSLYDSLDIWNCIFVAEL